MMGAGRRRIAVAVIGLLVLTGCSMQITYKEEGGNCIRHDQERAFGLPTISQEWPCDKDVK